MADVWQEKREFEETNLHMLNNDVLCDVTFLVGSNKDEVKAHKFMLASRSPVFYAMFCGPMSESSSTIEIPDIERETMHSILRFIYTEDCEVSGESVMALLYAAKKYSIKRLEQKCHTFLKEQTSCENVCTIFTQTHMMDVVELKLACFNFILSNCKRVLQNESFRTLPKELLKQVLESNDINATEADIYNGCKQWAIYQLRSNADESLDIKCSQSDIRNILDDLLYLIRFPTMSIEEFSTKCSHDDILSLDEKVSIFQFIAVGSRGEQFKFNDKIRTGCENKHISRFTETLSGWGYGDKTVDAIDFIVSETAMIFGIGLFSPCEIGSVKGMVVLMSENKSTLMYKDVELTYSPFKDHEEVLFDKGVPLEPKHKYTIKALLHGNKTFCGSKGLSEVKDGDLSITFSTNVDSRFRTNTGRGQIPIFILAIR